MTNGWKITAIVFIALFMIETAFVVWSVYSVTKEEEQINICFYDICEDYPDAELLDDVCFCYDYDNLGYLTVEKAKYMKD
jgi:hypothetical protein